MKIIWEYCECGCHCNTTKINNITYSYLLDWYKDTKGKSIFDQPRHFLRINLNDWQEFPSKKALEDFIINDAKYE
jgi:hypothetical protein